MSYTKRYIFEMPANPTIPGVTTTVTQVFDATQLSDRYIKQLCNGLRRYGTLPRWGGMYQAAAMLAKHLGTQMPVGFSMRKWWGATAQVHCWDYRTFDTRLKKHFGELIKLTKVREEMQRAAGDDPIKYRGHGQYETGFSEYWGLMLFGWRPHETVEFRNELRARALAKIPNYLEDMNKIADFLETRPRITLTGGPLKIVDKKAGGTTTLAI